MTGRTHRGSLHGFLTTERCKQEAAGCAKEIVMTMSTAEACEVIRDSRGEAIVVSTMGAMNAMDKISSDPLNIACVPLMGGAASLRLGPSFGATWTPRVRARRRREPADGVGGLGSRRASCTGQIRPLPLQQQYAVLRSRQSRHAGRTDGAFGGLARSAGYRAAHRINNVEDLESRIGSILSGPSPAFVELVITKEAPTLGPTKPSVEMTDARFIRMGEEMRRIRSHLV